jgi:hypothetical protein
MVLMFGATYADSRDSFFVHYSSATLYDIISWTNICCYMERGYDTLNRLGTGHSIVHIITGQRGRCSIYHCLSVLY